MVKYFFDEQIFQKIDTEKKAYWLGFLYADGCMNKRNYINKQGQITNINYTLSIALNQKDKQILINFLKFLKVKNNCEDCFYYDNKTNSIGIKLTRKDFCQDLIDKGIINNKTYDATTVVWESVPIKFKKDFILGLWDGDGSVSCHYSEKENKNVQVFSLISLNIHLLNEVVKYINNYFQDDSFCKIINYDYPRIRICYTKAKIFGDFLYENVKYPVMQRKYENYLKMDLLSNNKVHSGFDNYITKGVYCITSGKYYITTKEASIGEYGYFTRSSVASIQRACKKGYNYKNKQFRYCTIDEKEKLKNGEFDL